MIIRLNLKFIILVVILLNLSGCLSSPERVMLPIHFDQPISLHVPRNAIIYCEVGREHTTEIEAPIPTCSNIFGEYLAMAIILIFFKSNPKLNIYDYGLPQKEVFMTSLKDTLVKNKIFKHVSMTDQSEYPVKNDVLITVFFKIARVEGVRVLLDVELKIKDKNHPDFIRTYMVEGGSTNFSENKREASTKLLAKIILGIQQWRSTELRHSQKGKNHD